MPPLRDDERRDPMPGLLELPAYLLRQLGQRGRRIALAVIVATALAGIATALIVAPQIRESKDRNAAAERARAERLRAERLERIRAELVPRRAQAPELAAAGLAGAEALQARRALVADLERSIRDDARGRESVEVPVRDAACERFPRNPRATPPEAQLDLAAGRYQCLAITTRIEADTVQTHGVIGYPYRARADFETGAYAWCKTTGLPAEGALRAQDDIHVPPACGG
jgi:hypothetical protein